MVLVKCLKLKQKHSPQILQQHMEMISKLRHRHLVSVLGHCVVTYQDHPNTASTVFIVLENVVNGSLKDHLSGKLLRVDFSHGHSTNSYYLRSLR